MQRKHFANVLLFTNFLFTLHYTINSYINSSFLEQFISLSEVGLVFGIAAFIGIVILSQAEKLLIRFGTLPLILALISMNISALIGLVIFHQSQAQVLIPLFLFIVHYAIATFLLKFAFDVYFEEQSYDGSTGAIRGKLLTAQNLAWVISPLIFSQLLGEATSFWKVYSLSLTISIVLLLVVIYMTPKTKEPHFKKIYFYKTLKEVWAERDILRIYMVSFLLHFFFVWTVIYLPIYLHESIGFSWGEIGALLTIMLIPYILIDIPLGKIADSYLGEKELLIVGFVLLFIFTIPMGLITEKNFMWWGFVLFMSRFGSGAVEIMSDTYFFKKVGAADGNLISFFRNAKPFAYITGSLIGSILVLLGLFGGQLFLILAALMLFGLIFVIPLKDTR
tara:strand:+ start:240 stop:1415 length:1176 start_codon:yes stop_codon:yes gene_type:complete